MLTQIAAQMYENKPVGAAFREATLKWNSIVPKISDPRDIEFESFDPQDYADHYLARKFDIDHWFARNVVQLSAIARYYDLHNGLEDREAFAQAMYEKIRSYWSSPGAQYCDEIAKAYHLNILTT